jgi:hypothetical protein
MSGDDYLGNVLNLTTFGTDYAYRKLRERVNKTDWISHGRPAVINAFYGPLENSIRKIHMHYLDSYSLDFLRMLQLIYHGQ